MLHRGDTLVCFTRATMLTDHDISSKLGLLQQGIQDIDATGLHGWYDYLDTAKAENCGELIPCESQRSSSSRLVAINSSLFWSSALIDRFSSKCFSELPEDSLLMTDMDDTSIGCNMIDDDACEEKEEDSIMGDEENEILSTCKRDVCHCGAFSGDAKGENGLIDASPLMTGEKEVDESEFNGDQKSTETPKLRPSTTIAKKDITGNSCLDTTDKDPMLRIFQSSTVNEDANFESTRLTQCMMKSNFTQAALQDWDRLHGLPASHARTMVNTARSRKQLLEGVVLHKWDGTPLIKAADCSVAIASLEGPRPSG